MNESIIDGRYGPATSEIQSLIALADRASEAFNVCTPATATPVEVNALIQSHFDRLTAADLSNLPKVTGITFVMADAVLVAAFGQGADPETAWGFDWIPYREAVRSLRRRLNNEASTDPVRRGRLIPPIWPFAGKPSVYSEPRIARFCDAPPPIPWLLLCGLEEALTHGLIWAVARSDPEGNPFRSLLKIGALGLAPMGLRRERFLIYVPVAGSGLNSAVKFGELA